MIWKIYIIITLLHIIISLYVISTERFWNNFPEERCKPFIVKIILILITLLWFIIYPIFLLSWGGKKIYEHRKNRKDS